MDKLAPMDAKQKFDELLVAADTPEASTRVLKAIGKNG